ncbi:MAG TPA: threonine--tRNA ligase [Gaiellaceae bacterium]|nr:threonine--tRNA ligase [Gaiellaceae bacterium]
MKVVLPDNSELELPDGATALDAARAIGPKLAEQAVLARVDGHVQDLRQPLADGDRLQLLTTRDKDDPDALAVLRHSSSHLLAEAVRRLYPGVKIAIGPAIENGFYYDFDFPEPIREEDLAAIEAEVERELKEGRRWERSEISRDEARARFEQEGEPYKVELVDTAEGDISLYTQSHDGSVDFSDLCRGPHLQDSKPIKALKLTGLAGAYWRGDSARPQLTRIYGTAFYAKDDLDAYLARLERARERDHRRLGPQLDLFHMSEYSPGAALWTPKGMAIWNALEDMRRSENARRGYLEVKTPLMWDVELWKRSGHWEKYGDNLFRIEHGDSLYGLKPMNCPGHMLLFNTQLRSYRDLPIRYAEAAVLHRDEPTGALHGLTRARQFSQDDAHVFCTEEQIEPEIDAMFDYLAALYDRFGVRELAHAELATRPDNKLGTDEQWDYTEGVLRQAIDRQGIPYRTADGEGAFYGPKIDFFMDDALGRPWQMGTIQLDGQQPERLGCTYMGSDNREHMPYLIHRALFGSLERFVGILIEHYGGDFPFWLAPVQVRVLPVGEAHLDAARGLVLRLAEAGHRAEVAEPTDTIGKRIRAAELEKIPVTIVYGDRESDESLAVRERGGQQSTLSLSDLLARLATL